MKVKRTDCIIVRRTLLPYQVNSHKTFQNYATANKIIFVATKCASTWNGTIADLVAQLLMHGLLIKIYHSSDEKNRFCWNRLIIFVCSQSLPSSSFIEVNGITNLSLRERADNGSCIDRSIQFGAWLNVFESLSALNGHFLVDSIFDQDQTFSSPFLSLEQKLWKRYCLVFLW